MRSVLSTPVLFGVLLSAVALSANAASTQARVWDKAQEAYDALSFDVAAPLFERALREPGTREERVRSYKGLGLSRAVMGDDKGAKAAFEKWLVLEPNGRLEQNFGPKVNKPLEAARKATRGKQGRFSLVRAPRTGGLTASLADPLEISDEVVLYWRAHGEARFQKVAGRSNVPLVVETPPAQPIEAFAQAFDAFGGMVYEHGRAEAVDTFEAVVRGRAGAAGPAEIAVEVRPTPQVSAKPSPLRQPPQPAVAAAQLRARAEVEGSDDSSDEAPTRWPWWVGGGLAVVGGGAAAFFLAQPPPLSLPAASRTGLLP